MAQQAQIKVARELLRQFMLFPDSVRIIDARFDQPNNVTLLLEGDGLPKSGDTIPDITANYVTCNGNAQFAGWRLE